MLKIGNSNRSIAYIHLFPTIKKKNKKTKKNQHQSPKLFTNYLFVKTETFSKFNLQC